MHFSTYLAALAATSSFLVSAAPSVDAPARRDPSLRLIKTSETEPGVWVTEDEKMTNYISKKINFVDITDIQVITHDDIDRDTLTNYQDKEVLRILSTPQQEIREISARAITYPTTLTHVAEANALIANVNNSGPQSWLLSLTKYDLIMNL